MAPMTIRRTPASPPRSRGFATCQAGFTMIELGVVLTLVAIIATFAAPSFKSFLDTMDAQNAAMDLVGDLAAARSEALKRNTSVTVSPVGGSWSEGWQVKVGETSIRERSALRNGLSVSAPVAGVTFLSNGRLSDTEVDTANSSWTIESTHSGVTARCVVITPTGSARAKKGACS